MCPEIAATPCSPGVLLRVNHPTASAWPGTSPFAFELVKTKFTHSARHLVVALVERNLEQTSEPPLAVTDAGHTHFARHEPGESDPGRLPRNGT